MKYISPYCENSAIVRNWLNGEYGEANVEFCAPTIAVNKIPFTRTDFLIDQSLALVKILLDGYADDTGEVCVVGFGSLTYKLSEALLARGIKCNACVDVKECSGDVVLLCSMPNCINEEIAVEIKDKILVEVMPEQVDPNADHLLINNGNRVLPEFINDVSFALLEKFWERREELFDEELILEKLTHLISQIFKFAEAEEPLPSMLPPCWLKKIQLPGINPNR